MNAPESVVLLVQREIYKTKDEVETAVHKVDVAQDRLKEAKADLDGTRYHLRELARFLKNESPETVDCWFAEVDLCCLDALCTVCREQVPGPPDPPRPARPEVG